jgi:hypothetical protein
MILVMAKASSFTCIECGVVLGHPLASTIRQGQLSPAGPSAATHAKITNVLCVCVFITSYMILQPLRDSLKK